MAMSMHVKDINDLTDTCDGITWFTDIYTQVAISIHVKNISGHIYTCEKHKWPYLHM